MTIAGLFTWKLKLGLAIGLVAMTFWYVRHATTVAYERGVASGKQSGWDDAQKQMRATMDREWAKIKAAADELDQIGKQITAQRAELQRTRTALSSDLARRLSEITASNMEQRQNAQRLPSTALVPYILRALDDLDRLDRERAGRAAGHPAAN